MPKPVNAEDWDRRYATKDFIWTVEPNRFLVAEAGGLPPGRGLDLAAGEGRNSIWLAERGWTMRAVDFSTVAAEKGRRLAAARKVADRVGFEVADLADYVPEVHGFELVALFYLQVPQAALAPILARAARAVAPGGVFFSSPTIRPTWRTAMAAPRMPPCSTPPSRWSPRSAGSWRSRRRASSSGW